MRLRAKYPWWRRLWQRLRREHQARIMGLYWSLSINLCALLITAMCYFVKKPVPQPLDLTLSITASVQEDEGDDEVTIEPLVEPEPEPEVEPEPEPEPQPEPSPQPEPVPESPPAGPDASEPTPVADAPPTGEAQSTSTTNDASDLSHQASDGALEAEIERRVAAAGGNLRGALRVSLGFTGDDDIDLHLLFDGYVVQNRRKFFISDHIYYGHKWNTFGGLDVDANANGVHPFPAENIIFRQAPTKATYRVVLNHFRRRGPTEPTPYVVLVKYGRHKRVYRGTISPGDRNIEICRFNYSYRYRY